MNTEAFGRMEAFAKAMLELPPNVQQEVYDKIRSDNIYLVNEVLGLMCFVGLYKLMTDETYYIMVRDALSEAYVKEVIYKNKGVT